MYMHVTTNSVQTGTHHLYMYLKGVILAASSTLSPTPWECWPFNPLSAASVYIMLYVSQSSLRRAYVYAHTGIHSLPDADTANKLSREPLLIPTDIGNVSNRSEAPPTDRENLNSYFEFVYLGHN